MIPYILTDKSLTCVINGKSLTMEQDNPAFKVAVKTILKEEWDNLADLFDTGKAVENFAEGNVKVEDGEVYYKDEIVHGHVVGRILDLMSGDKPYKSVIRFLDKLMDNPSRRAVNELYAFLEHKSMPLTPEGNFLAYKGVRKDFTDWHSGKFDNKVGDVNEMPRRGVCDDYNIGCSSGFHAGSLDYAKQYGNGGHLMVVEIDPADVVSVPLDCDQQKLRTCKYKVVALFEKKLEEPIVYPNDDGRIYDHRDVDDCEEDDCEEDFSDLDIAYSQGYKAALKKLSKEFDSAGSTINGSKAN
jgi:hypothetical protein